MISGCTFATRARSFLLFFPILSKRVLTLATKSVRADAFFVGNTNSQFISGSGGNIEISSSNFHLSASGDVTMQGTITAEAGNIGDWIIKDESLNYQKKDASTIHFPLSLNAGETKNVYYTYRKEWK